MERQRVPCLRCTYSNDLFPNVSVLTLGIPSRDSSVDRRVLGAFLLINNSFK